MYRARERKVLLVVKGRRLVEARRSSSRERRVLGKGTTGSFALTVRAGRVAHLAAEGTSDRESARLSQGPRGTDLGGLRATEWVQRKRPTPEPRRRRQRCQRRSCRSRTGEENALARRSHGRRSGSRVVNRDSPQPRSHRVARAALCSLSRSSDPRKREREKRRFA